MVKLKKFHGIACPIKCVRKCLNLYQQQSKISDDIALHALKRGRATWYSDSGWTDAKVCAHGRWVSDVFKGCCVNIRCVSPVNVFGEKNYFVFL